MAFSGHEILLLIRGQNQASQALRRVALDTARLGSIRSMHLRQQQLAINQAKSMAQKQGILNRLQNNEEAATRARTLAQTRANRVATVGRGLVVQRSALERKIASIQKEMGAQNLQTNRQILTTNAQRLGAVQREQAASQKLSQSVRKMNFLRQNGAAIIGEGMMTEAQYATALKTSEQAVVNNAKSLGKAQLSSAAASVSLAKLGATNKDLAGTLDDTQHRLGTVNKRIEENAERGVNAQRTLATTQAKLGRDAGLARRQLSTVNQQIAQQVAEQRELAKAIRIQRWERVRLGASIMTHLGRVMQMAGLVGGAALGYLGYQAAKFNSEATLVATQTGKVGSGFRTVQRNAKFFQTALLDVMKQSTATREEITRSAYDIYSSTNVGLGGGIRMLKLFARASIAGMTPLQDVTSAGISVMNNFKLSVKDMPAIMNRMFAAVRFGRMNFAEFVSTISQTVPAFAAAGQSFDVLTGALAFITRRMPNIRMGATGLARMMEIMGRKEFVQGAKEFGVAITDATGRLKPLPTVLDLLIKRFPQLQKGGTFLQNFFKMITAGKDQKGGLQGTIQARRVFTNLVLGLQQYHQINRQVTTDNNEFSRSFAGMSKTAGVQFSIFLNNLKAFGIALGEAVLPGLVKLTKPLQDLAHWFTGLDSSQRASLGKWATYTAAILLFGGTVLSVGGMVLSFIATLGKFGIAGSGILITLGLVIAAVKVLNGEWRSLTDVVDSAAEAMTGSWQGFLAMSAVVVFAVMKIRKAFLALAAAQVALGAGTATGGALGILGGTMAAGRTASITANMYRAATGAGILRTALAGAGAFALALPSPLWLAAGAITAAAGGAFLWKQHMKHVADEAARVKQFQDATTRVAVAPRREAATFGRMGLDVREVVRQRNAIADLNAQIKNTRKEYQQADRAQKPEIQRRLTDLVLQRADAMDNLRTVQGNLAGSYNAMGGAVLKQITLLERTGKVKRHIKDLQDQLAQLRIKLGQGDVFKAAYIQAQINKITGRIDLWKGRLDTFANASNINILKIKNAYGRVARDLQRINLLPKMKPGALEAMLRVSLRRGRALSIPEMRAVIKAVADPASLRKMPRDIQAAVRAAKVSVKVEAKKTQARKDLPAFAKTVGKYIPAIQIQMKSNLGQAKKERAKANAVFKKPIRQPIHLGPVSPNAVALGASIAAGVASGVTAGSPAINGAVVAAVQSAVAAGQAAAKAKSPSKETRDKIGIPLVDGIIVGVMSRLGQLEKTSRLAIDYFNGPWLTSPKFTDSKKKVRIHTRDLIRDLQAQLRQFQVFNRSLSTLQRRGVPLALLDQLSQLGVEGADKIAKLANASKRQLNRYVAIWRQAMREIQRSTRTSFDQIITDISGFMDQAARNLLDKWNEIHDNISSGWDDLFSGFDEKIGEGFKSALESWQQNLDDLRNQVKDAYDQIADIQKQMRDHISDEFGKLFEGAVIASEHVQNKLNWGLALNMDDLIGDLKSQLTAFTKWRSDLASLVGKIPPELLSQLAELGPGAAAEIAALAGATKPQLDEYVGLWQQSQGVINSAVKDAIPDKEEFQTQINTLLDQIKDLVGQINALMTKKPAPLTPADLLGDLTQQFKDLLSSKGLIAALLKKGVPAEILAQLAAMGPEALPFLQALNNMTGSQLKEYIATWNKMQKALDGITKLFFDDQIKKWRKHGRDIALGIIAGIMDEQETLIKFFRKLFLNLLKAARKETKSHSPSMVFAALGEDLVLGLQMGLARRKPILPLPTPAVAGYSNGSGRQVAPINMTVNAHHSESLDTTLARAAFRLRNRRV